MIGSPGNTTPLTSASTSTWPTTFAAAIRLWPSVTQYPSRVRSTSIGGNDRIFSVARRIRCQRASQFLERNGGRG